MVTMHRRRGASLIEPLVALGLLSLGAVGTAALLALAAARLVEARRLADERAVMDSLAAAESVRLAGRPCPDVDAAAGVEPPADATLPFRRLRLPDGTGVVIPCRPS